MEGGRRSRIGMLATSAQESPATSHANSRPQTRRNYPAAIEAFQIALRTDVDDHMSWLRLGEAYSKAGRYAAAFKALERARELDPKDWVASYFIGEVQRQMGAYEESISAFQSILASRPQELGVLHSLGQSYLDLGRFELSTGFTARAETSFLSAVRITLDLLDASSGFRRVAWKTIADALYHLSGFADISDDDAARKVFSQVIPLVMDHPGKGLPDILSYPLSVESSNNLPLLALEIALAAYDYSLTLGAINDAAKGTAFYDLGSALSTYSRRTSDGTKRDRAQQHAIAQFKEAIRLEPGNDAFWVALGNATFLSQPGVCQHSYIRALEVDSKVSGGQYSSRSSLHACFSRRAYANPDDCRMLRHGPTLDCSICTMKTSNLPTKRSTKRRHLIQTMP